MAQHDYNIANQGFSSFRSDLNNALSAIQTCNSGTSRPTGAVAGQIWLDTTSATSPTLKYYDGADDISLATIDHSANTVNWLDSNVSVTGLTTTATGTVITLSDTANTSTVNLIIDNQKEVRFRETTANGTNYIGLKAPASVSADLTYTLPSADGTAGQFLSTNGSGVLSFATAGLTGATSTATGTVLTLSDTQNVASVNVILDNEKALRFREATTNGTNYVGLKAPTTLSADTTFTLPSADGTSGQVLQTNGSGVLSFSSPSAGSFVFLGETSGSGVASIDLNGYFTSAYDYYKIFLDGINGSVNDVRLFMKFATTGSYTVQSSNYYYSSYTSYHSGTNSSYVNGGNGSAQIIVVEYLSSTTSQPTYAEITLYNPLSTSLTKAYTVNFHTMIGNVTDTRNGYGGGAWNDTTAITGLRFNMESGNVSARKIRIYGIKNS